eukprot:1264486-Rhodomonas_salina.1
MVGMRERKAHAYRNNETFETFRKRLEGAYNRLLWIKLCGHTKAVAHELHCMELILSPTNTIRPYRRAVR